MAAQDNAADDTARWWSPETGQHYASQDDLVAAEGHGWVVVVILRKYSGSSNVVHTFTRVAGIFDTQRKAQSKASVIRKRARKWVQENHLLEVMSVNVEPLWKDLH